jgi:hypothetical protein
LSAPSGSADRMCSAVIFSASASDGWDIR